MIIDIHAHLAYHSIYPDGFLSEMFIGLQEKEKSKLRKVLPLLLRDKDGSNYLKQMDNAGIDKAVFLIMDAGIGLGEASLSIEEIYELHYHIIKKNPDRFIAFGGIDPRRGKEGLDLFKKGIFDYGFKGLKLYPPMGFAMDDERLLPFYDICNKHNLPVLIHTGPSLKILKNEFADPLSIAKIAQKYPDVKFILAHAGYNLTTKLSELVLNSKNIYLDIAGFRSKYFNTNSDAEFSFIIQIFKGELNKKILFGTDWPLFNLMHPVTREIEQLKHLAESSNISNNEIDNIFYKNALHLLSF
jgi:uncharacterized protein